MQVSWPTVVKGDLMAPISIATTKKYRRERCTFPRIATPYNAEKQASIKYHFLSLWYDST